MANAICSVDDCERPVSVIRLGWCSKHYQRWRARGTMDDPRPDVKTRLLAQRFIDANGCWIWTGRAANGSANCWYGVMSVNNRPALTHRLAYELWVGPIPSGFEIDHVKARGCKSTKCFNPEHLEAVTHRENLIRGAGFAAVYASATHCKRGHLFDEANTYYPKAGGRSCRVCRATRNREAYRRRMGLPTPDSRDLLLKSG